MAKPLSSQDFRSPRWILEPDDFLISNGQEEPPSDLVAEDIWNSIVMLPDDVSIRTSSHYGAHLRRMLNLWAAWIDASGDPLDHNEDDPLFMACLEAADEFSASLYNALCGYYRVSASCLRAALEPIVIGTFCQLADNRAEYQEWRSGAREIQFGRACDILHSSARILPLETHIQAELNDSIFAQRRPDYSGGSARRLHSELSKYAHSAPGYTSFDLWDSTGPVFEPASFLKIVGFTYETSLLCFSILKLARPDFELPGSAQELFHSEHIHPTTLARVTYAFLFPHGLAGA